MMCGGPGGSRWLRFFTSVVQGFLADNEFPPLGTVNHLFVSVQTVYTSVQDLCDAGLWVNSFCSGEGFMAVDEG